MSQTTLKDLLRCRFLVFVTALLCCSSMAAPPALPAFVRSYLDAGASEYELPRGQFEPYLRSYFEEQSEAEPWAAEGDFNGDAVADWAGLLRNAENELDLVVIYSVEGGYTHNRLSSLGADGDGIYFGVVLEPVGEIHGFPFDNEDPDPVVNIQNPGIHLFYYEKSSVLYFWDDGTFREFWTSD